MPHQGIVKTWNERGFGFIRPDFLGDDIFVHCTNLQERQALERGQRVSFETAPDVRNPARFRAIDVTVIAERDQ
jgi:cold shock CspA family protein